MILNIDEEDIVLEVRKLVCDIDNVKEEANIYCDLVKQIFLSGSKKN